MILIKKDIINKYLDIIGQDQNWLASYLGIKKGFLSQILANKCKIPNDKIEKFLLLGFKFEKIFYYDSLVDNRKFYGKDTYFEEKLSNNKEYKNKISKISIS